MYMVVARLVYFLLPAGEQKILRLSPRWLAKVFVAADVISFFIQAAGGGMLADQSGGETVEMGQRVYMAGIGVQLAFVVLFVVVTVLFALRLERLMRAGLVEAKCNLALIRPLVWSVLAVIALIVVSYFLLIRLGGGLITRGRSESSFVSSSSVAASPPRTPSWRMRLINWVLMRCRCCLPSSS